MSILFLKFIVVLLLIIALVTQTTVDNLWVTILLLWIAHALRSIIDDVEK